MAIAPSKRERKRLFYPIGEQKLILIWSSLHEQYAYYLQQPNMWQQSQQDLGELDQASFMNIALGETLRCLSATPHSLRPEFLAPYYLLISAKRQACFPQYQECFCCGCGAFRKYTRFFQKNKWLKKKLLQLYTNSKLRYEDGDPISFLGHSLQCLGKYLNANKDSFKDNELIRAAAIFEVAVKWKDTFVNSKESFHSQLAQASEFKESKSVEER